MPTALVPTLAVSAVSAVTPAAAMQLPRHSALHSYGAPADRLLEIGWVLYIGAGLIFVGTMILLVVALAGPDGLRRRIGRRWIIGGGIVFPVVVLSALLVHTFGLAGGLVRERSEPVAARIQVKGELWWWRVRYLDAQGAPLVETANEIHIPVGQTVEFELVSDEVIHSFWVPSLAGKLDLIPGVTNRLRLRAAQPGIYRGQCAEFCGVQHAKMALLVVAEPPERYTAWLQAQRAPAAALADPVARQGQVLFAQARCGVCHTVRGTSEGGRLAPDLTHVGSRLSLAAGTLPNGKGALAGWILDPQHLKPGSRMPAYRRFTGEELRALAHYLAELR
jgi:cytochrome c oxidase subunit II